MSRNHADTQDSAIAMLMTVTLLHPDSRYSSAMAKEFQKYGLDDITRARSRLQTFNALLDARETAIK